jgi:hypothetical protein
MSKNPVILRVAQHHQNPLRFRKTIVSYRDHYSEHIGWIHVAQGKVQWRDFVNTVMNYRVLEMAGNFLTSRANVSFPRRNLLHLIYK